MDELKNLIATALEKGFATPDERVEIRNEFVSCDVEDAEEFNEDLNKIEDLPLEKPEHVNTSDEDEGNEDEGNEDEGNEDESVTGGETRAERRAKARAENQK